METLAKNAPKRAKLGGAGLALIALCNVERIFPGTTDLDDMRHIGNFIQHLKQDDGTFASRFDGRYGKDDSWVSLYYPGEAALGLVYLAEVENDEARQEHWISIATEILVYLEGLRRTQALEEIEPDHWALLASSRLIPKLDPLSVEYWLVYNHAVRVAQSMLVSHTEAELIQSGGCFTMDRRTCPTATRLEGLLAACTFVKDHEMFIDQVGRKVMPLRERMVRDVQLGIDFLLRSQQQTNENNMKGAVPGMFPPNNDYDLEHSEVRVDYVQHSMSAVIAYERIILHGKQRATGGKSEVVRILVIVFFLASIILFLLPHLQRKKSRRYDE